MEIPARRAQARGAPDASAASRRVSRAALGRADNRAERVARRRACREISRPPRTVDR
ncbi:hypothetical protein PSCLAVI8L_130282 [Pseudoclavibacter sp. 8L]|nr:hypothetical protein PSCLAVI8L_130282 [Pseudoclavibacter sp. 8L]